VNLFYSTASNLPAAGASGGELTALPIQAGIFRLDGETEIMPRF
jgi:hypothetical protein